MKSRMSVYKPAAGVRWSALLLVVAMVAAACSGDSGEGTTVPGGETGSTIGESPGTTSEESPGTTADSGSGEPVTFTVAMSAEPSTLDPQMHRQRNSQIVARQVHDNLTYIDPLAEGDQPAVWKLATGFDKPDDLTWDLTLREGVTFHDGTPFTSEAVVYTFNRMFDPEINSPRAPMYSQSLITSVEAIDDYTVRFTTSEPVFPDDEGFPHEIGAYGQEILKPGYYDDMTIEEASTAPTIGTGPFKFVEWVNGQHIRFETNSDYWDGPPQFDEMVFRYIAEESTRAAELIAGNVDLVYPVGVDTLAQLANEDGITLHSAPGNALGMMMLQTEEGRPFADPDARRGLNAAIDRELIVETLFAGRATVETQMQTVFYAGTPTSGYDEDWEGFQYDPELARELLSGVTETVEMITTTGSVIEAEAIAQQLRDVGLDVEIFATEAPIVGDTTASGDFDFSYSAFGSIGRDFGADWNTHFHCSRLDNPDLIRTGYCNPELDAQMDALEGLSNEEKTETYKEVARALADDAPWVPLWTEYVNSASRDYVKGYVQSPVGQMNLWTVYFEK